MRKIKGFVCVLLCFAVVVSLCACGKDSKSASYFTDKKQSAISASANSAGKELYINAKSKKQLEKICQSGMLEMYFDKETYSVCIYDGATGAVYRSLPKQYTGEKSAALYADILVDGNRYTLDSQSDSVAFSSALYEKGEDFVKVNYSFKRTLDRNIKISFNIPVIYSLKDGVFSVEIPCDSLVNKETSKNVTLESISVLPFFGSSVKGEKGDFILLPDGSGAVMDISSNPQKGGKVVLDVYGGDMAVKKSNSSAVVGAFGMKNNGAFLCLIEKGDTVAKICAEKALKKGGSNQVYSKFTITPTLETEDGVYVSEFSYKDSIRLSYRFLPENATYITMAGVCREMLVRNGVLSGIGVSETQEYPFNLQIDFTENSSTVTDILQCEEILNTLKAKGVSNINLIVNGFASIYDKGVKLDSSLGSDKQYKQLINLLKAEGINFTANVSAYAPLKETEALSITGEKIIGAVSAEHFEKNTNSVMHSLRKSDFDSVYISDAGAVIYSDFNEGLESNTSHRAQQVSHLFGALSSFKKLFLNKGNVNTVKYAECILNLAAKSSLEGKALCKNVPFIQAVLHGEIKYSLEAANLEKDTVKAMLKCVEYGAIPYYRWHYADLTVEENKDSLHYMNTVNQAQLLYENAKNLFYDLQGARITAHQQLSKNLYMTQYDGTTKIYVNYGKAAVSVDGVTVDAKSFLRVN